ncbi:3-hydroxy-5-methyl-1-naphthoate 3-O-methyltransferase [Methylacidimicrobium cyclopophantes]|uniref:3-hydroxy-5-methyl-1-naphthoate 3-O-methyltransferase n=1 Tax=Methylacidimicrobium cyclopophantes TaxID=1041766 RepID=A0A5E6MHG2_9BACT|nr:class I SAM-dependent methyltransferase [Methylacidimicrobium cyclopophantes]VVM04936.1 3-hydroxy-5-methyl-1-naphthoate 3-O-methyltransferase [Methylacidimicrobium cyclopophantes]
MNSRSFSLDFDPAPLLACIDSVQASRIVRAAVDLGVFFEFAKKPGTAEEVAAALGVSLRGTRALLDSLTALQLLGKEKGVYSLLPIAEALLVPGSPDYLGDLVHGSVLDQEWDHIVEAVRKGGLATAAEPGERQKRAEEFFPQLIRFLHVANRRPAIAAAKALGAGTTHRGMRVLDIACGSGVWSLAVAYADRDARITAVDFPGVLEHTRRYGERHGLADQYEYLPGDIQEVDFPENRFDLAILGHILHGEGEGKSRKLLRRLAKALRRGGRIAILEFLPNRERTGPPEAVLFGMRMFLNTEEGGVYSAEEYAEWLAYVGFTKTELVDIGYHSPLLIASRAEE